MKANPRYAEFHSALKAHADDWLGPWEGGSPRNKLKGSRVSIHEGSKLPKAGKKGTP